MSAAILDHLWQSTLFAGAAGLLTLLLRGNAARVRFWVWFTASVKFLVPFAGLAALGAWLLPRPAAPLPVPGGFVPMAEPLVMPVANAHILAAPAAVHVAFDWSLLVLAVWGLGTLAIALHWLSRWLGLRAAMARAGNVIVIGDVAIRITPEPMEPGLFGIWRPVVLLPQGIEKRLSQAELEAVLAHEACHMRHRDNLWAAIHMLVEVLFWFHPLVWWLGARLNHERERACDEAVVAAGQAPEVYAESILKVCRLYAHSPLACVAGVSGADLKERIERIVVDSVVRPLGRARKLLLAGLAAGSLIAPLSLGLLTAPPGEGPAVAQTVDAPHPGTEAALRHQIESMEKGQPDYSAMVPSLAQVVRQYYDSGQISIQRWGAFKSIAFRENQNGNDVYLVEFDKQLVAWTVGPLQPDGKIGPVFNVGLAIKRDGNGPSPGLEAAIRRELDGALSGNPPLEVMSQRLQTATQNQWKAISGTAKALGALQTITFQKVNARGWDVYHATFANGTETIQAAPLTDGKLDGLFHTDVLVPHAPQHPGTEAWMRRHIAGIQNGTPNYSDMGPFLTNAVRQQWPDQQTFYKSLGAFQSLAFEGGGGNETDVYVATFKNRKVRWHIGALDATGKVDVLFFQR
ncbi:MAG TPA: M56 family metallopeptidase [Rhizomicrobium sp.]